MNKKLLAGMIAVMTLAGLSASANDNENVQVSAATDSRIIVEVNKDIKNLSKNEVVKSQDDVMKAISRNVTKNFKLVQRYSVLNNAFVIEVNQDDIEAIRALNEVASVTVDKIHAKQDISDGSYYSARFDRNVGLATEDQGDPVSNISAETMYKPAESADGEGTVIAILDNEFYLKGATYDDTGAKIDGWNHAIFKALPDNVYQRFTFDSVGKLIVDADGKPVTHAFRVEGREAGDEGSLYYNSKVPFYFDYGGESTSYGKEGPFDFDVSSTLTYHGSHVSSIASANADTYKGIAPKAQLACMKVFTTYIANKTGEQMGFSTSTGAYDSAILSALEDAILLGVDGINMSLGSDLGDFDGDSITMKTLARLASDSGILTAISAGNAGKSSYSFTGGYGNWTTDMVETGILGSYANSAEATIVASGQPTEVYFENAIQLLDDNNQGVKNVAFEDQVVNREGLEAEFAEDNQHWMIKDIVGDDLSKKVGWQYIPGFGTAADYSDLDVKGKVAVVNRGSTSFADKYNVAVNKEAIGLIIINNDPTATDFNFRCSFGDDFNPSIPCALALYRDKPTFEKYQAGEFKFIQKNVSHNDLEYTISTFSSDGAKFNYDLKPDITTPGENIRGAVPPQKKEDRENTPLSTYEYLSGTSMAAPNYAGAQSLVLSKAYKEAIGDNKITEQENDKILAFRNTVDMRLMSTANPMLDPTANPEDGKVNFTSPRMQGAGMVDLGKAYATDTYLEGLDLEGNPIGKSKIVLKNNDDIAKGVLNLKFVAHNESQTAKNLKAKVTVMRPAIINDNKVIPDSYNYTGEVDDIAKIPGISYYDEVVVGTEMQVKKITNPGGKAVKDVIKLTKQIEYYTTEQDFKNKTNPVILTQGYYYNNLDSSTACNWEVLPGFDYQSVQDVVIETYTEDVTIPAGDNTITLASHTIPENARKAILEKYPYGCAIEGFVELYGDDIATAVKPQLSIPFLGFYSGAEMDGRTGASLTDAPVVEPFAFEKDPDQVYPSDLVNDVTKQLVGKDNCEFGSTWTVGYAESVLDIDTDKVLSNDTNFEEMGTEWRKIGVDPATGEYFDNPEENLYVGNPLKANTMIIQQYVMRSVKDNFFTVKNSNGDIVYKSALEDMLFGEKQLYKSHVDANYLSAGYVSHRAYAIIPLYDPMTHATFADGTYTLEFNYQLAYNDAWVNKSYNFVVDATAPEVTDIIEYTGNSGEQRVKFLIKEENKLSLAYAGYDYVDITYDQTIDRYVIDETKESLNYLIDELGTLSNGQKRLTLNLIDAAYGESNAIIHFFGNTFSNYVIAQGSTLKTNEDFVKDGQNVKWYTLNYGGTEEEFEQTGYVVITTHIDNLNDTTFLHGCVDNNNDHKCDVCGEAIVIPEHEHIDSNNDGKCDICGEEIQIPEHVCVDANKDGLCDICGEEVETPAPAPDKKGCGGAVITASALLCTVSTLGALLLLKKKEEK